MLQMSYKAVVFDFGGVIMNYCGLDRVCAEKGANIGVDPSILRAEMQRKVVKVGGMDYLMKGIITGEDIEDELIEHYPHATPEELRLFSAWIGPGAKIDFNKGYLEAISRLRALGFKLILLTNNFFIDKNRKWERTPVNRALFDIIVESALEGEMKPERTIYDITQSRIEELDSILPTEVVFLDDLEENLRIPDEMGWTTIRVDTERPQDALRTLEKILSVSLLE